MVQQHQTKLQEYWHIEVIKLTIDVSVVRVSSVDCPIVNVIDVSELVLPLTSTPKIDVDISALIPSVSDLP